VKDGIVHVHPHSTGRIKQFDEHLCQQFPYLSRQPAGFWKSACGGMVGIVRTIAFWFCKRHNTSDGSACGAQYLAVDQVDKDMSCWLGKDERKVQDYGFPCRCESNGIHIGLRETGFLLPILSTVHFCFYSLS
jgi:hypothetical protein